MMPHDAAPDQRNRLLAAPSPADYALLAAHLRDVRHKQGVLLQAAGDPIEVVYVPRTGNDLASNTHSAVRATAD